MLGSRIRPLRHVPEEHRETAKRWETSEPGKLPPGWVCIQLKSQHNFFLYTNEDTGCTAKIVRGHVSTDLEFGNAYPSVWAWDTTRINKDAPNTEEAGVALLVWDAIQACHEEMGVV